MPHTLLLAWVSRHDTQAVVIGAGILAASLAAILALFRQPMVYRPLRWLGRVLVADPLTAVVHHALDEWAARVWEPRIQGIEDKVDRVVGEFHNNGGSTMRDRVDAVAVATGAKCAPPLEPGPTDAP